MFKRSVLVIDDEEDLIDLIRYNLVREGFNIIAARDGESGLSLAFQKRPDLVVIDLMLPGIDGFEVCRSLRAESKTSQIPIIMLTAKASESDRIVGLELGADDYITKPFSPGELTARVKALLRRTTAFHQPPAILKRGNLTIDLDSHEVSCGSASVELTATEYRLLQFMASNPGRVYTRDAIIDGAMGREVTVLDRTVDVHIMSLRRKLGNCGKRIETLRGFGYRFRQEIPGDHLP
jgi:two-component system, OmpR family, alkaline phosphatase synthesis response regulator PhoP